MSPSRFRHYIYILAILPLLVIGVLRASALTGGPDGAGYYFVDSDEATGPVYNWIDISASGTATLMPYDDFVTVPLGFTLDFYGISVTEINITSNGGLVIGPTGELWYINECIPADNWLSDDALIAPWWDHLDPEGNDADDIYYETQGSKPNRTFIVQWEQIPHHGVNTDHDFFTFEVILFEGTNDILFQYEIASGDHMVFPNGGSATTGIQIDQTTGLQYSCEDGILQDELAILYYRCFDNDGDGFDTCSGDCDDGDAGVNPDAVEVCDDLVDNDCNGDIDEEDEACAGDDDTSDDDDDTSDDDDDTSDDDDDTSDDDDDTSEDDDDAADDDTDDDTDGCSCRYGNATDQVRSPLWPVALLALVAVVIRFRHRHQ